MLTNKVPHFGSKSLRKTPAFETLISLHPYLTIGEHMHKESSRDLVGIGEASLHELTHNTHTIWARKSPQDSSDARELSAQIEGVNEESIASPWISVRSSSRHKCDGEEQAGIAGEMGDKSSFESLPLSMSLAAHIYIICEEALEHRPAKAAPCNNA